MNKGFVTKPVAIRLKELGFDQPTVCYYLVHGDDGLQCTGRWSNYNNESYGELSAPTWTEVAAWLWKRWHLWIEQWPRGVCFYAGISGVIPSDESDPNNIDEYEVAFLKAMEGLTQ